MQFNYTLKPEGQKYLLKIDGVGQKLIDNPADAQEEAKRYIEASQNVPLNNIKLNFVAELNDSITSNHVIQPYNKRFK